VTSALGPNFLIIGAAKGGTTSLAHYLRQHPDVFVAREKECHHFLFEGTTPSFSGPRDAEEFQPLIIPERDRYLRCFASAGAASARGEASVYYLYRPESLERALTYNPLMRFVVVLRDPVKRAFSAWAHMMRDGRESEHSFLAAVDLEAPRTAAGWSYGFRYESVGRYGDQLAHAMRLIPADQLHVALSDDLVADPETTLANIFAFLGVRPLPVDSSLVMNVSGRPRVQALNQLLTQANPIKSALKKVLPYRLGSTLAHRIRNWNLEGTHIDPAEAAVLAGRYRDDVERLAVLLQRDLSSWSPAATGLLPGPSIT
jgi:hypothetical protein